MPPSEPSAADWLAKARAYEARGELILAYDTALRGLETYPDDVWLKFRAVLALAKSGATRRARVEFARFALSGHAETDIAALEGRIAKDEALGAPASARPALLAAAADLYARVYARDGSTYPGINVATLRLLAGQRDAARKIAAEVLRLCESARDEPYYVAATRAEALLVAGRAADAEAALTEAAGLTDDLAARATTRRQLRLVCRAEGIDEGVLAPLAPPATIHFVGHRIAAPGAGGAFPAAEEARVAAEIAAALARHRVGFGYGALASGADILFAEALLARGAELHVVLPFARDEFAAVSVTPAGEPWRARFEACLACAASVRFATEDRYLGHDALFGYGAELAMGLAVLGARFIDGDVRQIAVWNGGAPGGAAGTAVDLALWRARGRETEVIALAPAGGMGPSPASEDAAQGRSQKAMLFGDVKGFSKLREAELPGFVSHVLGALGAVLAARGDALLYANTWGDGIFAVFDDPAQSAECALDLQAALEALDLPALGLPDTLALRLGVHYGPVYAIADPVQRRINFFGDHVSRTARIEPVTPPGEVYVTEQFAAWLALAAPRFASEYVGEVPAAKGYGSLRMYLLRRA